jgi:uncharacterized protein (DUF486 family)
MPVLVRHESNGWILKDACVGGRLSRGIVKRQLTGRRRLSDSLNQLIIESNGTGFHLEVLAPGRFEGISMPSVSPQVLPVLMLFASNVFMTFAWYGHLKFREVPLYKVILISWLIAFFEYCFQVPANRIGSYEFTAAQLKTIQEVITLTVFAAFSVLYLKQPLRWNYLAGFALIVAAVAVIFKKW